MRYARQFNIDFFSRGTEMFAFPFGVVTGGDCFHAVIAHPSDVLVIFSKLVKCLRASHQHYSKDAFFFLFKGSSNLTDLVFYFQRCSSPFAVNPSVPLSFVPLPPGCFKDEWLQVLVWHLQYADGLFFPLPDPQFCIDLHAMPHQ